MIHDLAPHRTTTTKTTSSTPEEATFFLRIKVRGNRKRSVNIRRGPSTDFPIIMTAHGGDSFPLIAVSPSTGWYKIKLSDGGTGYITNLTKYTDMEAAT
ncbi:MAG: SH3 domain-containing protein [Acidaminococcaceae bacterium]|nr:SH3 domain-containing protein [Acidaminococcaceae bacterium]